jgi:hypothetical protein
MISVALVEAALPGAVVAWLRSAKRARLPVVREPA